MATSISNNNSSGQSYQSPSGSGINARNVREAIDQLMLAYASQQHTISSDAATLAQVEAQQSALAEQIDGFNDSIATIAQQNEAIAAQQTATNNKVATFSSDLAALAAQQSSFADQIAALIAKNAAMAQQYTALSAGFAGLQEQINGLSNAFNWKNYQPALKGSTSDPTVTYAYRVGRYVEVGKLVIFFCNFQSTNITKSSGLADALRISLPVACAANQDIEATSTTVSTAVGGIVGNTAYIKANSSHLEVGKGVIGGAIGLLNYSLTGLGALNSAITYIAAGVYEKA